MSPYLSRTPPENLVEGRRRVLYSAIFDHPGISFTELREHSNIRFGVLQYHLETLERAGFVESLKVGRFRRYYPLGSDHHAALERRGYAADAGYLRMMVEVETLPGSTQSQLQQLHPGVARQSVAYRLQRLERVGAIRAYRDGRTRRFELTPEGEAALERERAIRPGEGHCPDGDQEYRGELEVGASAAGSFAVFPGASVSPAPGVVEVEA